MVNAVVTCLVVINIVTFVLLAISTNEELVVGELDALFGIVAGVQCLGLFGELPRLVDGILSVERFQLKSGWRSSWNEASYHMSLEHILNIFCTSSVPTHRADHSYILGCSEDRLEHDP